MKDESGELALAIVAGGLARAIDPRRRVYMADNSRYRPDAHEQRERAEAICARHDLRCVWPSEHAFFPTGTPSWTRRLAGIANENSAELARLLRRAPLVNIEDAQAVIAELTPFRGPHLNPVVALEIGIAVARGRPIFGWTEAVVPALVPAGGGENDGLRPLKLRDRVRAGCRPAADGYFRDGDGNRVENFDLIENAAIAGNLASLSTSIECAVHSCAAYFQNRT